MIRDGVSIKLNHPQENIREMAQTIRRESRMSMWEIHVSLSPPELHALDRTMLNRNSGSTSILALKISTPHVSPVLRALLRGLSCGTLDLLDAGTRSLLVVLGTSGPDSNGIKAPARDDIVVEQRISSREQIAEKPSQEKRKHLESVTKFGRADDEAIQGLAPLETRNPFGRYKLDQASGPGHAGNSAPVGTMKEGMRKKRSSVRHFEVGAPGVTYGGSDVPPFMSSDLPAPSRSSTHFESETWHPKSSFVELPCGSAAQPPPLAQALSSSFVTPNLPGSESAYIPLEDRQPRNTEQISSSDGEQDMTLNTSGDVVDLDMLPSMAGTDASSARARVDELMSRWRPSEQGHTIQPCREESKDESN